MVKLVNFQSVKDQIDKVLINLIHLDNEISLIDGLILSFVVDLMENTLLSELVKLRSHIS